MGTYLKMISRAMGKRDMRISSFCSHIRFQMVFFGLFTTGERVAPLAVMQGHPLKRNDVV